MKTVKDYQNLYLKCDVLLLADVFEKFRNNSLKNCGLCSSHYLSAPSLSWDAMLKMIKIELELISDPDIYVFFEKGTIGGISYISNRCSKANNKYLKACDPKQEPDHIVYLDVNNLYGYAMSKFFPTSGFECIDPKEFDLNKYKIDLEYSKELQALHNDHPLAPDKIEIKREMLSEYKLKVADLYDSPIGNVKKSVPNFFDKEKYVLHYE